MTLEQANSYIDSNELPDWAARERWTDLAWISDNLPAVTSAARIAYEEVGRGAVVIDSAYLTANGSHPAAYFTESEILRYDDADISRLVAEYVPDKELVLVLLKESRHNSAYRVRIPLPTKSSDPLLH
jgi:hypothetical protein